MAQNLQHVILPKHTPVIFFYLNVAASQLAWPRLMRSP